MQRTKKRGTGKRARGASRAEAVRRRPSAARARAGGRPAEGASIVGVIDVGSQALRLALGEIVHERPTRRLETLTAPVSIGVDTFSTGRIRFATTEAVARTLADFLTVARSYGVEPAAVRAVATTAVRDARNRDVFLDRVERATRVRVEVIEPIEETRLVYHFVRHLLGPRFDQGTCVLLSLGAGGTQIIVQHDGEIVFGETRHFGVLQLWGTRPSERAALVAARAFLGKQVRAIQRVLDLAQATSLVVINKELFQLLSTLARVEVTEVGLELQRRELERLYRELDTVSTHELLERTGLDYPTVEVGRMALEELHAFASSTSAESMLVPSASMLDCLLLDARLRMEGAVSGSQLATHVESAARTLGRKYRFDEPHAEQVRRLALQVFDALVELTHLSESARLLLSVASLLHDIGYYVSFHQHERHSAYLINASEIMGLSRPELERIATVVLYHRRPARDLETAALSLFPPADRVELLKLAALLRLADALDEDSEQRVERLRLELAADELRVYAESRGGHRSTSMAETFTAKADLFGEVFGIEPTLTEVLST